MTMAIVNLDKLQIEDEDLDLIENEVGMSSGGWDTVKPDKLVMAVLKVMLPKICRNTPGSCFCGCHVTEI